MLSGVFANRTVIGNPPTNAGAPRGRAALEPPGVTD